MTANPIKIKMIGQKRKPKNKAASRITHNPPNGRHGRMMGGP